MLGKPLTSLRHMKAECGLPSVLRNTISVSVSAAAAFRPPTRTPQQIGKIGKAQETATNDALAWLADTRLPKEFFGYAFDWSMEVRNRMTTHGGASPHERRYGTRRSP
eukprot:TRINITY_DN13417_c0_g1_i1.p1 TRINITY_DN13417_c0_g1~~TRINITY_DN13417_c0_g1_i1.p1  ORF type:complete len:108 (-),score=8.26 TRINITY_DN13417_c0_g1_i1:242-565(-)